MELDAAPGLVWRRASERISGTMGLHFPEARWADMRRGLEQAAAEFGCADAVALAGWLSRLGIVSACAWLVAVHVVLLLCLLASIVKSRRSLRRRRESPASETPPP